MTKPSPRFVQRVVNASPEAVFDLLADPSRHAELDGSGTVRGVAPGTPQRLHQGAEFAMRMRMGVPYSTTNRVVAFEPNRVIAWQTGLWVRGRKVFGGQVWRYELTPLDDGRTMVRESYDLGDALGAPVLAATAGPRATQGMQATLERLAMLVDEQNRI